MAYFLKASRARPCCVFIFYPQRRDGEEKPVAHWSTGRGWLPAAPGAIKSDSKITQEVFSPRHVEDTTCSAFETVEMRKEA